MTRRFAPLDSVPTGFCMQSAAPSRVEANTAVISCTHRLLVNLDILTDPSVVFTPSPSMRRLLQEFVEAVQCYRTAKQTRVLRFMLAQGLQRHAPAFHLRRRPRSRTYLLTETGFWKFCFRRRLWNEHGSRLKKGIRYYIARR